MDTTRPEWTGGTWSSCWSGGPPSAPGRGSDTLRFNCAGWGGSYRGPFAIVDGLQRLTAARAFIADRLPAFGRTLSQWADEIPSSVGLVMNVNDLATRADVLRWYIELNSGGIPHSDAEIGRVRALLEQEIAGGK